jgi:hypothetical protein
MSNSLTKSFDPLSTAEWDQSGSYIAELKRNEVAQIIASYHHDFDHFYESIQNAVDACEKAFVDYQRRKRGAEYTPKVEVVVNLQTNALAVIDNGVGMPMAAVLKYFFTPYATLKAVPATAREGIQRGEKGVGATFVSYGSNYVHLSTRSAENNEMTSCKLIDGLDWCNQKRPLLPLPHVEPCEPHAHLEGLPHGTVLEVHFSDDTNIRTLSDFAKSTSQWETILRLHTALGYVDFQESDPFLKSLRATLTVINEDGRADSKSVTTGYLYPHLTTEARVQLTKLARTKGTELPESQRDMNVLWEIFPQDQVSSLVTKRMENMRYLRNSTRQAFSEILSRYKPEAYVAFVYAAEFWDERNHEIWGASAEGPFRHGIVYATKSQKVGEQKRIDFKYRSGDFNRFFILLNMRELRADIGRKSLPEEINDFANFFANAVQNTFVHEDDCLRPSPGPFDEGLERELEELKDNAFALEKLEHRGLHFTRVPREEQDVVALFFDLLGGGKIRGFDIYSTHISRTYDGIGQFRLEDAPENHYEETTNPLGISSDKFQNGQVQSPSKNFIEFKYSTDGLVNDVRSGYKRLHDIKWLVCWEVGEKHVAEGIGIIDITGPAQINKRDYYGATHIMTENQAKVFVICLKTVLEFLKTKEVKGADPNTHRKKTS